MTSPPATLPAREGSLLRIWITLFFLLSGATALVYQVIWVRMLGLAVGHSVLAVSAVVAAYMAGLGAGARLAGPTAQRTARPLVGYGLLEVCIGLFALFSPSILGLAGLVPSSGTAQLAAGGLLLLPPTLAMGATLPMLTAWYARDAGSLGRDMGWLYAINTTGAVIGAGAAGFVLLPALGQPASLQLAAAINLAVGVAAIGLGWRHPRAPQRQAASTPAPAPAPAPAAADPARGRTRLLLAFGLSGGAAMINQVAWNRGFSLFTGSTTYAFSLIVCSFIAGLAIGGHLLSRVVDRVSDRGGLLAGLNIGIAVAAALLIPILGELPLWLLEPLAERSGSFGQTQRFVFGVLFGLLLLPTVLMGGTYPVVTRAMTDDPQQAPAEVGRAYAWNTAGAIVGSLGTGLVLIPAVGLRRTLWLAVAVSLSAAAVLLWSRTRLAALLPLVGIVAMFASPKWDPRHMNLAPHIYARDLVNDPAMLAEFRDSGSVQLHEEGLGATITVLQRPSGAQVLRINGKTDASTEADRITQGLIGALPLLLTDAPREVFVLGLGSGMTVASTLAFPVEQVRVVELLPEVIRGARRFGAQLGDPLDDPRVSIVVGDGRHAIMSDAQRYDVIISQPTNLFISGMSTLFTAETFAAMRDRLDAGGVAMVWVQGYLMFDADFRAIVRTFQHTFPEAHLWSAGPNDFVLTGHTTPLSLDLADLDRRLSSLGSDRPADWAGLREGLDLQRHYLMGPAALAAWTGDGPLHADADPFLEFRAPRALFADEGLLDVAALAERRALLPADDPRLRDRLAATLAIDRATLGGSLEALQAALRADPGNPLGLKRQHRLYYERAHQLAVGGDLAAARAVAAELVAAAPALLPAWRLLAEIQRQQGDADAAAATMAAAAQANPHNPYAHYFRGMHLVESGQRAAGEAALRDALALDPALPELRQRQRQRQR